jgi:hypothetical protein
MFAFDGDPVDGQQLIAAFQTADPIGNAAYKQTNK